MGFFHFTTKLLLKAHVNKIALPAFPPGVLVRYKILFSGRVQRVGFRAQLDLLAQKIGLTGFAKNQKRGAVLAELQGTSFAINALLAVLRNERRFILRDVSIEEVAVIENETKFSVL